LIDWIGGIGTSLRSAFQHCYVVFKKEVTPFEIRIAGIKDRTKWDPWTLRSSDWTPKSGAWILCSGQSTADWFDCLCREKGLGLPGYFTGDCFELRLPKKQWRSCIDEI